ncbi:hypothetical protein HAX54_015464 [Datura stramonium]|uniref:Uncharacterized protein n=1 Tax=Datura stramonium TaxID=4076 RepID=A0ABS8TRY2_DATST|nr:hypothetical protein [Datura stramonium]
MSSSSPLSFHMKKPSKSSTGNIDDLSLVKATTLANWYEEFEVLSRNYKKAQETSSRYKLRGQSGALKLPLCAGFGDGPDHKGRYKLQVINKEVDQELSQYSSSPNVFVPIVQLNSNDNNISLFDKYEIEKISSQLDQYIENSTSEKIKTSNSEKKLKIFKGFLLFKYYYKMKMMNVCVTNSYDDVVVVERRVFNKPESPEKLPVPVPAVKFATCRPWRRAV